MICAAFSCNIMCLAALYLKHVSVLQMLVSRPPLILLINILVCKKLNIPIYQKRSSENFVNLNGLFKLATQNTLFSCSEDDTLLRSCNYHLDCNVCCRLLIKIDLEGTLPTLGYYTQFSVISWYCTSDKASFSLHHRLNE